MDVKKHRRNEIVFGIDLGTCSLSCTGYNIETGKIIKYYDSQRASLSTKVVICKKTGEILCGREILDKLHRIESEYIAIDSIKSFLGSVKIWKVANKEYRPEDLIAALLISLKKVVKEKTYGIILDKAVFSITNDFSSTEREALRQAANLANIEIIHMINESIAAVYNHYEILRKKSKILVIDWGASTLDLTMFANYNNSLTELKHASKQIGGNDIDYQLAKLVHNDLLQKGNESKSFSEINDVNKQKLVNKCEAAKRLLSKRPMAELSLTYYGNTIGLRRHISNEELVTVVQPVLEEVSNFIEETLNSFETRIDELSCVLAIGGSFYIDYVKQSFLNIWNEKLIIDNNDYNWSVSKGAAKLAVINGVYSTTTPLYVMLSDETMFKLIDVDQDIDLIEKEYSFAIVEDCDKAYFVFYNGEHRQVGYLLVPVYGFYLEKIVVDIWSDNNNIIHIRACSDRKPNNDSKEWLASLTNLRYKLPELVI